MLNDYFLLFPIPRKSLFYSVNEHDNFVEETKILIPNDIISCDYCCNQTLINELMRFNFLAKITL